MKRVPVFEGLKEMIASNIIPGGTVNNMEFAKDFIRTGKNVSRIDQIILADAQTSGGLLFTIPQEEAEDIQKRFEHEAEPFHIIGRILQKGEGIISIISDMY